MKLDFRTKALMTIVISFVLLFGNLQITYPWVAWCLMALPYMLLLSEKKFGKAFKGIAWLIVALILEKCAVYFSFSGLLASVALFFSIIVLRMLPGIVMGEYSLLTTSMSDLVTSLQKMKLPDAIIIPISVMFRFFYTVKEDYQQVTEAMYLHGLVGRRFFRQPLRMIEYRFVPLLLCLSRTADDVAISATTRGMVVGQKRSTISNTKLRILDYVLILAMLAVLVLNFWSQYA